MARAAAGLATVTATVVAAPAELTISERRLNLPDWGRASWLRWLTVDSSL
jgi:hypothetical protein